MQGWIRLHRKVIDNGWLRNHKLWVFWTWCLLKATHKETNLKVGFQEVILQPGQFIFGRRSAAEELNMSEWQIRSCIDFLKKARNIAIKTTNKFSIISIVNWAHYQSEGKENRHQNHQQPTNNPPQTRTEEQKKINNSEVHEVFSYWQQVMNHSKAKLTDDRRKNIKARLEEGYTVEDVKKAIDGCKVTPHNMGLNDRGTVYDDIELICRKGSKLEHFINNAERAKRQPCYAT